MVVFAPVPVVTVPPGIILNVQVLAEGKLFNTTLPEATVQVGWVIFTTVGASGTA